MECRVTGENYRLPTVAVSEAISVTKRHALFSHSQGSFLPARRIRERGLCYGNVSVRLSVYHTPVLCLNG